MTEVIRDTPKKTGDYPLLRQEFRKKGGSHTSGARVMVPISALAIAEGAGGSGTVGPPTTVSVPEAIATLIWLETWRKNEKPLNWTRLSIVARTIGLSMPVSGSIAVH